MSDTQRSTQVLLASEWQPTAIKMMPFKKNERGGGSISIISTQMNKALRIETPPLSTFGIADYVDSATGESDGRYNATLNLPNEEYATPESDALIKHMKEFESHVLDWGVTNSESLFGKKMTRELVEDRFFSIIKYRKDKETGRLDETKPPNLKIRIPYYDGVWNLKLYDYNENTLFPSSDPDVNPIDLVPKYSQIACVIQCGGMWFGGKGWGITWKLNQAVVKPRDNAGFNNDVCMIRLSKEDKERIDSTSVVEDSATTPDVVETAPAVVETEVEDSDDEKPPSAPVKKVLKKPETTSAEEPEKPKKKVLKKKVVPP
tara:strand:- start:792 stop:1745 length:954 start_codon:yes stop_codon:yes gene_type:complete